MEKIKILDHGYIELIEVWGSDESIICAARMSTDKSFLGWLPEWECIKCRSKWYGYYVASNIQNKPVCNNNMCVNNEMKLNHPGDEKLLKYLYTEKPPHTTPFEMAGMIIEVQAPILVFREWHRHRVQSFNEMSARYTPLPNLNYIPSIERLMLNKGEGKNKQAGTIKDAEILTEENAQKFQENLKIAYDEDQKLYEWALQSGVPKELARVHLPVGRYSRMRASANLLNWLKFLTLRMHGKAQHEIRVYANAVGDLIKEHFPRTYALFDQERPK